MLKKEEKSLIKDVSKIFYVGKEVDVNVKIIPDQDSYFLESKIKNYTIFVETSVTIEGEKFSGQSSKSKLTATEENAKHILNEYKKILVNDALDNMSKNVYDHAHDVYVNEHEKKYEELDRKKRQLSHKASIAKWILGNLNVWKPNSLS